MIKAREQTAGKAATNECEQSGYSLFTCVMLLAAIAVVCFSSYILYYELDQVPENGTRTKAKISWYWPPLLGPNCAVVRNDKCISRMASGQPWQNWVGRAVACPKEYPFGTVFIIDGKRWVCLDRGEAVTRVNHNTIWLDMLIRKPVYKYGTIVDVIVLEK